MSYPPQYPHDPAGWQAPAMAPRPAAPREPLDLRVVAAFVAIPLIVLLDSFVWFGMSSVYVRYLTDTYQGGLGLDHTVYGDLRTWQLLVMAGAIVLGGVVAIGLGPRFTMVLGLLICAAGVAATGLLGASGVFAAAMVVAVGQGIYRPTVYAAAAEVLPFPRGQLRNVLFVVIYLVLNLGAALSSWLTWKLMDLTAFPVIFMAFGGALFLAAIVGLLLAFAHLFLDPVPSGSEPESGPAIGRPSRPSTHRLDPRFIAVGLGLIVVTAIPWMSVGLMWELQYAAVDLFAPDLMYSGWFFNLDPLLIIFLGLLLAAILLVLHLVRFRIPTLLPVGLGLLVMGAGMAALLLSFVVQQGPLLVASIVVLAAGEVLMAPLLASRIAGDQHGRLVTLMIALWLAASYGGSQLLTHFGPHDPEGLQLIGWAVVASCVVVGVLLAIAAYPLRKALVPAPEPPPPGTPLPY